MTGQFSNKVVDSAQSSTTAKYTKLGGGQTSSDGGYISQTSFTEYAPTLAEGRTITGSYTVTLPTEVQNGTLSVTNDETPLSAGEDATITVSFVEIVMHKVTITVDEGVDYQITAGEEVIENLESIASGTELTITFNSLPENKKIESVLINEQPAEAEENGEE